MAAPALRYVFQYDTGHHTVRFLCGIGGTIRAGRDRNRTVKDKLKLVLILLALVAVGVLLSQVRHPHDKTAWLHSLSLRSFPAAGIREARRSDFRAWRCDMNRGLCP